MHSGPPTNYVAFVVYGVTLFIPYFHKRSWITFTICDAFVLTTPPPYFNN
jgi:hypothetical protein